MRTVGQLRKHLRHYGFTIHRRRGSHEIWNHPQWRGRAIVLHGRDSEDACGYQRKRVQRACELLLVKPSNAIRY